MNDHRYRKISVKMHADEKYLALSAPQPNGRSLWEWLLHGPMTGPIPGVLRAGVAAMAEELDWDQEGFDKAFREVLDQGMAEYDPKNRIVWLPNAIKHNKPASPNVVVSWGQEWGLIKECELKTTIYNRLREFVFSLDKDGKTGFSEAFDKAIAKPLEKTLPKSTGKTLPIQEQEQEQKQKSSNPAAPRPSADAINAEQFELFKEKYPKRAGSQPWSRAFKVINARLREGHTWEEILQGVDRYARFCSATRKVGTEKVMQAATFCGPDKLFTQSFDLPGASGSLLSDRGQRSADSARDWLADNQG